MTENRPDSLEGRVFSRVPVWAIAGWLVVQTLTAIWWAAKIDERMSTVETAQRAAAQDHTTIARMDERTLNTDKNVARLVDQLELRDRRK